MFTQADLDDREPLKNKNFHDKIFGNIRKMDTRDLMINIFGLSIFLFADHEIIFFDNDKNAYIQFLKQRKETVKQFLLNSIVIKMMRLYSHTFIS